MDSIPIDFEDIDGPLFNLIALLSGLTGSYLGFRATVEMQLLVFQKSGFLNMFLYTFASILALVFMLLCVVGTFGVIYEFVADPADQPINND